VDAVTTPQALVRSLLASTAGKIKAFEAHLDRIEQRATDIASMVGYCLSNDGETMTDAIATGSLFSLEEPEQWKRMKRSGAERCLLPIAKGRPLWSPLRPMKLCCQPPHLCQMWRLLFIAIFSNKLFRVSLTIDMRVACSDTLA